MLTPSPVVASAESFISMPGAAFGIDYIVDDLQRQAWMPRQLEVDYSKVDPGVAPKEGAYRKLRVFVRVLADKGAEFPRIALHSTFENDLLRGGPPKGEHVTFLATFPPVRDTDDFRIGVAVGDWNAIGTVKLQAGKMSTASGAHFLQSLRKTGSRTELTVDLPKGTLKAAYRLVALGNEGKVIAEDSRSTEPSGARFSLAADISSVRAIQLQAKPYRWFVLKGVPLRGQRSSR